MVDRQGGDGAGIGKQADPGEGESGLVQALEQALTGIGVGEDIAGEQEPGIGHGLQDPAPAGEDMGIELGQMVHGAEGEESVLLKWGNRIRLGGGGRGAVAMVTGIEPEDGFVAPPVGLAGRFGDGIGEAIVDGGDAGGDGIAVPMELERGRL